MVLKDVKTYDDLRDYITAQIMKAGAKEMKYRSTGQLIDAMKAHEMRKNIQTLTNIRLAVHAVKRNGNESIDLIDDVV